MMRPAIDPGRRRFLQAAGGSLVLAFPWRGFGADAPRLPGSLDKSPLLDGWVKVAADGAITVFTGKAELGQGITTALLQVAAEELVVAPGRIRLVTADTDLTANEGYTAGSHSMQDSGTAIRHASAQVRGLLVGLAAQRLALPPEQLLITDGSVHAANGPGLGYGELVRGLDLHVTATPQSPLRNPAHHRLVGLSMPRVDIPAKVTGGAAYVQDLRLEGMVHGRILRPPSPAARLRALDAGRVEARPGVLRVVRDGRFLGVIAEREWQAVTALRALADAAQWDESESLPPPSALFESVQAARSEDHVILERGQPDVAGAKTVTASYRRPYQLHASVGPSCAVAQLKDGRYTVWTHTQGVFPLRGALAELLGAQPPQVHCIHVQGSGCYGHNAADDVAADAALLARALPGRPVRVQWMREDEFGWEPFGPPMVSRASASLDADGRIVSWDYAVWSATHSTRPGKAGDLLAGQHVDKPFEGTVPRPLPLPEGGGDRNAIPIYRLPNARVMHHFLPDMPLRVSALRSLGAYLNVLSIESFMDELALAAHADPVPFRLKHLDDPRAAAVIEQAAGRFGWDRWQRRPGLGRGFAFARYKNLAAYCAIAIEAQVLRETGEVRLLRVVAAIDSGEAVNPDGIRNQVEGGIIQSASWTLSEEVGFDRTRVTSRDWGGYPILRFPQVPRQIEVHVLDRPGLPFLGTGEASQGPSGAAICNAIADATGARLRELPLSRPRVRAAVGA